MTPDTKRPWPFAAVFVMVPALPLLVFSLADPIFQLLPGSVAACLLIGTCAFGPMRKVPLRLAVAFLLPGGATRSLALLDVDFWAVGWMLGLPAWGLLLTFSYVELLTEARDQLPYSGTCRH